MTISNSDRSDNERDKFEKVGSGKTGLLNLDSGLTQCIAYSGTNAEYIGEAVPGTAKGATTGWRIKKLTYASGLVTDIKWASGTANFDKEWDERASYSYS